MLILTRQEKIILIFLLASLAAGLGVCYFRQQKKEVRLEVVTGAVTHQNESLDNAIIDKKIINLNHATLEELTTLPGIGPGIAQKILSYRQAKGPFKDIAEVKNVPGIGSKRYAELQPYLTIDD